MRELIGVIRKLGFEFRFYAAYSEIAVRGNAVASGDDEHDKEVEDEIINRLNHGNLEAWFDAECFCHHLKTGINSSAFLGGCSYNAFDEFLAYNWRSMARESYHECAKEIERIKMALVRP